MKHSRLKKSNVNLNNFGMFSTIFREVCTDGQKLIDDIVLYNSGDIDQELYSLDDNKIYDFAQKVQYLLDQTNGLIK